jgi:hypothetical protein
MRKAEYCMLKKSSNGEDSEFEEVVKKNEEPPAKTTGL